jgi:predicted permease
MAARLIADLVSDVRYGLRTLRKQPGFTFVAVLTLALGIGANTATFSVVHSVLLRPLPYRDSARLVRVSENVPGREIGNGRGPERRYSSMDVADFLAVSARSRTIVSLASYGLVRPTTTIDGGTTRLEGYSVSVGFFPMLGVAPAMGRTFTADEGIAGNERVLVLGYDAWQRFGADSRVIGRTLTFTGDPTNAFGGAIGLNVGYTVIGVMPRGFRFPRDDAQFWIPRVLTPPANGRALRLQTIARLADGVTPETAAAEIETIQRDMRGDAAAAPARPRFELVRLYDEVTSPVKPALLVLTAAVGVVLLIACVNMANLLLARAESRQREIAVRAAIGAARGRLARQLLAESLLLAGLGGVAGTALAFGGVRLFRILATTLGRIDLGVTSLFPRLGEVTVDSTVLGYALVLSIAAGVLFGLVPAIRYSRADQIDFLRDVTSSPPSGLKNVLVVGEIALAMLLLVGGGLLINSFVKLATVDVGFDPSHLLTFQVTASGIQPPNAERVFAETLVDRLRSVPGVQFAAYARQLPMVQLQDAITLTTRRNGADTLLGEAPDIRFVSRDYLTTIGARLISGRSFGETDGEGRPGVVVINDAFARREFAGENPIGQVVYFGPQRQMPLEIIGVVGNVRQFSPEEEGEPQYFMDMRQVSTDPAFRAPLLFPLGAYYTVRISANMTTIVDRIRTVVRQLDPQATLANVAMMEQIVSNSITRPWMYAVLVAIFAAVAVSLAAIGLYGVMAYTVTQRTREIGIRMALGADRARVLRLVLKHSAALTMVGLIAGLTAASVATRYLAGMLFGLTPLDPVTYAAASLLFGAIATLASYVPAHYATKVDPIVTLRSE